MTQEEADARARCIAGGKNPDAMWPGRWWDGANFHLDGKHGHVPWSYAWRAYTDPPQFRRADPMPTDQETYEGTIVRMEPDVHRHPDEATSLASIAISLRRIADVVASDISLDEVLRDAVNNLANTLAEHRMYSK